jgi:hypothetical protein
VISRNPAALLNAGGALLFGALAMANLHLPFPDTLASKSRSASTATREAEPTAAINTVAVEVPLKAARAPGMPRPRIPPVEPEAITTEVGAQVHAEASKTNQAATAQGSAPSAQPAAGPSSSGGMVTPSSSAATGSGMHMVSSNPFIDPVLPPPPPVPATIPLPKSSAAAPAPAKKVEKPLTYKPGASETPAPSSSSAGAVSAESNNSTPTVQKPRATQPPTPSYTLSAATGDKAWVREGNDQTLTVTVGDSLTGYGKITEISPDKVTFDTGRTLNVPARSDSQ